MIRNAAASPTLGSFGTGITAAVVGATGGIGAALAEALDGCPEVGSVVRLARRPPSTEGGWLRLDLEDEESITEAAAEISRDYGRLGIVIVATGILHDGEALQPEKSWRDLSAARLQRTFSVNAAGPALVAKHFLPLLASGRKAAFAALSARVGSTGDNRLGGWHGYRASKAALNMLIRGLAIELARRNPDALCVGLHPGTVDTPLSKPFQRAVPEERLFPPAEVARKLLAVLDELGPDDSGRVFAWDGKPVPF